MSPLEKSLFRSSAHFLIRLFVFLILSCMSSLYILDSNTLLVSSFEVIFSHSIDCLFVLLMVSFAVQKLLSLIRSRLFTYFRIQVEKDLAVIDIRVFCLCFPLRVSQYPIVHVGL